MATILEKRKAIPGRKKRKQDRLAEGSARRKSLRAMFKPTATSDQNGGGIASRSPTASPSPGTPPSGDPAVAEPRQCALAGCPNPIPAYSRRKQRQKYCGKECARRAQIGSSRVVHCVRCKGEGHQAKTCPQPRRVAA